ncbi:MAG: DnaA ATPase domain-containing protein [Planctomycetota bacterium]|jgi:chromosomal replication initiator protein
MDEDVAPQAVTHAIGRHLVERIGRHSYDMWFGHAARLQIEGSCVEVATESRFVADWIDGHFRDALDGAVREALGESARVDLRVAPDLFASHGNGGSHRPAASNGADHGPAHDDHPHDDHPHDAHPNGNAPAAANGHTDRRRRRVGGLRRLEDFVVGSSNKLAFAAARRLTEGEPAADGATRLFLHGECGVGKTHLLQGIARRSTERRSARGPAAVRYLTAEQFTNEYINAVRGNTIARFRKRTRGLELLAIDDVHFLANKTATQNEFLYTIDAIDLTGGRLVLASDEHPRRLGLNEALGSRFLAGMVAGIERPDPATRVTLIHKLSASRGLALSPTAAETIADRCSGSVRELEGAVNKLAALHLVAESSHDAEVGLVLVEQLFRDGSWRPKTPLRIDGIIDVVCARLVVSRAELLGTGRHRRVVTARGLVAWLARELTTLSYPEIAQALGRKHHSTVHTAAARITRQLRQPRPLDVGANGETRRLDELVDQLRHDVIKAGRS